MSWFRRARGRLTGLPQPLRFAVYAVGFALVAVVLDGGNVPRAALAGLVWAALMSGWDLVRSRR